MVIMCPWRDLMRGYNQEKGQGLRWWSSGWDLAFQCRGRRCDHWLGAKIPRASVLRNRDAEQTML